MLPVGQNHPRQRDHALFLDRLPNYSKGLARDLAFRGEIVGPDVIELVDLVSRHESVDLITRLLSRAMASSSSSYTGPRLQARCPVYVKNRSAACIPQQR